VRGVPSFDSTPSSRRIERASLRSALPLRRVWYSPYAIDAARASRRWRMGGPRRHRRDISTHTSASGRRVDREALTIFVSTQEGMLNDLAIGHDHQADFESYVKADSSRSTGKLDFSVQVLTTGYWPTFASIDAHLPPEIVQCTKVFKDYYDEKNSKRRVTWMWSLGNASVKAFFGKKAYDLQVATLQAIVLLTFNPVDGASQTLTYAQVAERVNLPDEHLKRVLHSLACGKYKVLAKTPMSSRVALTDSFAVNTKFSCPMRKIRVPMASLDESHNPKRVEEDRTVAIEAAVVRIMKARKALSHQSLLAEVLSQLAFFRPNPKVIKRRIEALIDREYLERDPEVANAYRYLA